MNPILITQISKLTRHLARLLPGFHILSDFKPDAQAFYFWVAFDTQELSSSPIIEVRINQDAVTAVIYLGVHYDIEDDAAMVFLGSGFATEWLRKNKDKLPQSASKRVRDVTRLVQQKLFSGGLEPSQILSLNNMEHMAYAGDSLLASIYLHDNHYVVRLLDAKNPGRSSETRFKATPKDVLQRAEDIYSTLCEFAVKDVIQPNSSDPVAVARVTKVYVASGSDPNVLPTYLDDVAAKNTHPEHYVCGWKTAKGSVIYTHVDDDISNAKEAFRNVKEHTVLLFMCEKHELSIGVYSGFTAEEIPDSIH
jgi:hypothetical protein